MGIGKGKSDSIDIDGLMGSIDNDTKAAQEESNLSKQIAELQKAAAVLNVTIDRAEKLITGINNSVKELQEKGIGAQVHPQTLKSLNEICTNFVVEVGRQLMAHRDKQLELQKEHEKRMARMLEKNQGIWLSDKWMKVLFVCFLLYNIIVILYVQTKT